MHHFTLFSEKSTPPKKIALYRGSFDPPHAGHQEVVQYCLSSMGCDHVFIVANEANGHKPNRHDYAVRRSLLEIFFKNQPNLMITDVDTNGIIESLRTLNPSIEIIGVMGSDGALIAKQKQNGEDKFLVDSWLIIPRAGDPVAELPRVIGTKKAVVADANQLHDQQHSSTAIRRYFFENDDFYTNSAASTLPIPEHLIHYIRQKNLYRCERSSILHFLQNNLQQLPVDAELSTLTNSTQAMGGLSGDAIYLVKNQSGENVLVVKAFHGKEAARNLSNEITAIHRLARLNLQLSAPLTRYFYQSENQLIFMAMEVAKGLSLRTILENVRDNTHPQAKQTLAAAVKLYAQAFAELHGSQLQPANELARQDVSYFADKIEQIYASIANHHEHYPTLDLALLRQYISDTIEHFIKHPGNYSHVHGDPNLGNFFIQLNENHITMIDAAHLSGKWMDSEGNPKGFPANEFLEGISMIALFCHRYHMSEDVIAHLQQIFKSCYQEYAKPGCLSNEALDFFSLFWLFREINIPLRSLENYSGRREFEAGDELLHDLIEKIKLIIGQVDSSLSMRRGVFHLI